MKIQTNEETIKAIQGIMSAQEEKQEAVRIYVAGMGCSGPSFGLTLDAINDTDVTYTENDLTFAVEKNVFDQVGDIIVELVDGGYSVKPVVQAESACGSCAGSCG